MEEPIDYMDGVREYNEGMPVRLCLNDKDVEVIVAHNEGGHNFVQIDVKDLILWIKKTKPDLLY